jgi:glycine/D-amino acid oxidase-like deaminating enzyme
VISPGPTPSYWLAEAHEPLNAGPIARAGEVDVVIVGGGVTGCSCALSLAERGLRVRLLEAREIAGGASGRNGGFALRGGAMPYDEARSALGADRARLLWELSERAIDRLEELAGDACRRVGSLRLSQGAAEAEALERELEALHADGFAVDWVDPLPPALERLFSAAILHPGDAAMQPARWVRRLAAHAVAAGAEIREHQAAHLDELDAPAVVVAVDALSGDLLPELAGMVAPQRGQMLVTEPLRELVFERPHYAREGYDYWQQLPDGRLVVGGRRDVSFATEATAVEETTELIQRELDTFVVELLGELPAITHRWAGVWGETADRLPLVGRLPTRDRVWIAGGYSGHGNVLGLACGDLLARAILGDSPPELELFDPARLQLDALHVAE